MQPEDGSTILTSHQTAIDQNLIVTDPNAITSGFVFMHNSARFRDGHASPVGRSVGPTRMPVKCQRQRDSTTANPGKFQLTIVFTTPARIG